jgi:hypothetical protein
MGDQPDLTQEPASVAGDNVTLGEVVLWSMRPESECCDDNPDYVDFAKRYETSRFRQLLESSIYPAAQAGQAEAGK